MHQHWMDVLLVPLFSLPPHCRRAIHLCTWCLTWMTCLSLCLSIRARWKIPAIFSICFFLIVYQLPAGSLFWIFDFCYFCENVYFQKKNSVDLFFLISFFLKSYNRQLSLRFSSFKLGVSAFFFAFFWAAFFYILFSVLIIPGAPSSLPATKSAGWTFTATGRRSQSSWKTFHHFPRICMNHRTVWDLPLRQLSWFWCVAIGSVINLAVVFFWQWMIQSVGFFFTMLETFAINVLMICLIINILHSVIKVAVSPYP